MDQLIQYLPLLFICIPVLMSLLVYLITLRMRRHKWQAIHLAVQGTAIFYIIAVTILIYQLFQINITAYLLICIILILSIILIFQWKKNTEVLLGKAFKVLWRALFLLFFTAYCGLLIYLFVNFLMVNYSG